MQLFHSHGISCDRIETEALKLSAHGSQASNPNEDKPLKVYNDMFESLGKVSIIILHRSLLGLRFKKLLDRPFLSCV